MSDVERRQALRAKWEALRHEARNLLTVILHAPDELRPLMSPGDALGTEILDDLKQAAVRMEDVVKQVDAVIVAATD